jgi:hypothetical protein
MDAARDFRFFPQPPNPTRRRGATQRDPDLEILWEVRTWARAGANAAFENHWDARRRWQVVLIAKKFGRPTNLEI